MDRGAWRATGHGVFEGQTQLSDFTFTFRFHALEKEMATHSSVLAWRIPWTEGPGGLQSLGLQRIRHDQATNTHTHTQSVTYRPTTLTSPGCLLAMQNLRPHDETY